jgi:hypothetical protein
VVCAEHEKEIGAAEIIQRRRFSFQKQLIVIS